MDCADHPPHDFCVACLGQIRHEINVLWTQGLAQYFRNLVGDLPGEFG
jgi:hypothetical protein